MERGKTNNNNDNNDETTYIVTFLNEDDEVIKEVEVNEGEFINVPEYIAPDGYMHVGWDNDEFYDGVYADITTKVIIEIITFNVKFFDINDELIYEEEVKWGDKATFKDVPEEENKEFIGWYYYDDIFDIDEIVPYSMDLKAKYKNVMGDNYKLLTDDDFQPLGYNNLYKYIGSERYVVVPEKINGETVKSTEYMFANTNVISVSFETPENIKNTSYMFSYLNSDTLLLEFLDTLHVENMQGMFEGVNLYELDFTYFNTENVTNMNAMFRSVL